MQWMSAASDLQYKSTHSKRALDVRISDQIAPPSGATSTFESGVPPSSSPVLAVSIYTYLWTSPPPSDLIYICSLPLAEGPRTRTHIRTALRPSIRVKNLTLYSALSLSVSLGLYYERARRWN
ncbi:hypothetical protein NCU16997 [Neurospora crassa OR74A]|uniref:Uncharacterized protein n=1 Tax=Neurospora crassa (strain ATCC 24698 / 74-OR23-1A / CBS 708.71 / DSM 1257 / FGSC 987) TaxID=367110 RepID=V5IME4_NEUCR|nr:hypothetical protein NCU16997 [Neurospora crassa OR74A]ESA42550.1 hypothetical protein NCU16997 [Neurospora crassa OR74A]|eukprot:XP_011394834.1 hypothetical protein NCU16997 [Neurospora crassa OR74A]